MSKADPFPGVKDQVNLTAISLSAVQEICDLLVTAALQGALSTPLLSLFCSCEVFVPTDPAQPAVGLCVPACSQTGANGVCQKKAVFLEQYL